MTNLPRLRRALRRALRLSLLSPALAGCGGLDAADFTAPLCAEGAPSVAGMIPSRPIDYVELRRLTRTGTGSAVLGGVRSSQGTRCGHAADVAACLAAVGEVTSFEGFSAGCGFLSDECSASDLVTTEADQVTRITTKDALLGLLAPIDSSANALLWAWADGRQVCGEYAFGTRAAEGRIEVVSQSGSGCGESDDVVQYLLGVAPDGTITELESDVVEAGEPNCVIGRRHAGLQPGRRLVRCSPAGRYLANAARLEAASVDAFVDLGAALAGFGAPRRLRAAAARAADDEVRHAHLTGRLSARYGAAARAPTVVPRTAADLEALALENAVEGCVRETFGALCGAHQAATAADPVVRAALAGITADETEHALLAWQLAAWVEPRLDRGARRRVDEARRAAVRELRAESEASVEPELCAVLGLPTPERAVAMMEAMQAEVWAG